MTGYVAFLRAVNVGRRTVAMERLREEFAGLGLAGVSTYINSGNVIFSASDPPARLEARIEGRLDQAFVFEVTTFVRTTSSVTAIAAYKPFGLVGPDQTHLVAFLRRAPKAAAKTAIESLSNEVDTLEVYGGEVHWLIQGRVMDSTIKPKDWVILGHHSYTTRNTTMLAKLAAKWNSPGTKGGRK